MGSSTSNFTKPAEVEQGGFHVFELHMPSAAYSGFFVIFISLLVFFGVYFCLKKCNFCKRFFSSPQNVPPNPYKHPFISGKQPHGRAYLNARPSEAYSMHMPEESLSGIRSHIVNRGAPRPPPVTGTAPIAPQHTTDHISSPPGRRSSILSLLESNPGVAATAAK